MLNITKIKKTANNSFLAFAEDLYAANLSKGKTNKKSGK